MEFKHHEVEEKWKAYWSQYGTNKVDNDYSKPKYYILDMFPYPSGSGLHVGHPLGYIASDILARYWKMKGYNVLHPMGFDAFGLPAEQYAIQTGMHPRVSTEQNIDRYRKQLNNIGINYDWSREVITSDPNYYKWTQWIFIQLFNSYYCTKDHKAKPIEQIISHFEKWGSESLNAFTNEPVQFTANDWKNKSNKEKDDVLMNFRLVYRKKGFVNWCEALGTVLANDEIKDGVSERGGHPVEKKPMMQWAMRITAYAERLLADLDHLQWSDSLKAMQRNWIGKSIGAQVHFQVEHLNDSIEVFTTRPDTIFGVSFIVLAPEHELVKRITTTEQHDEVEQYLVSVTKKTDLERLAETKIVNGVFSGSYCIHPFSGKRIPIWISEYVLIDYGSGAIMAVPSHDLRDQAFALKFGLPLLPVVDQSEFPNASPEEKMGIIINSDFLNQMNVADAIDAAILQIEAKKIGNRKLQYRMRDANFSRQRYWGEPFPVYFDSEGVCHTIDESELPLTLPEIETIKPGTNGKSPIADCEEWVNYSPNKMRETDTMPGYAGSSWYFLRYMDPHNQESFASKEALNYWQDVDFYIGGTEHAVGHLMYSRFWHKFLYDSGYVPTTEPFKKLVNQGMIQGVIESICLIKDSHPPHFISSDMCSEFELEQLAFIPVHVDFVSNYGSPDSHLSVQGIHKFCSWLSDYQNSIFQNRTFKGAKDELPTDFKLITKSEVGKMSKRYHNVVNPDDVVDMYGADVFRMYEMFLGPLEDSKPWDTKGITGVSGFIKKYFSLVETVMQNNHSNSSDPTKEELMVLHTCIKKVSTDIEQVSFNTSVSAFMICVNELRRLNCSNRQILKTLNELLAPFAPFITEEVNAMLGEQSSVHHSSYPIANEAYLVRDTTMYPVSVNGKKRYEWTVSKSISDDELKQQVLELEEIKKWIEGHEIKKLIFVPGRAINIVI